MVAVRQTMVDHTAELTRFLGASQQESSLWNVCNLGLLWRREGGTTKEDQMPTSVQAHRLVSSDRVIGTDVYGVGDEAIGQIDHLLIEKVSGKIAYAIMNFGGFLELAHKYYPIPWTALRYDTELGGYRTGITESHLRDAPEFSDDMVEDRDWEIRTHQHYGVPPYWGA
jgi:hypothetical protein